MRWCPFGCFIHLDGFATKGNFSLCYEQSLNFIKLGVNRAFPIFCPKAGVAPRKGPMKDRVRILKDWIEKEGRKQTWVAQQVGCSPQWLSYVLKGKKPMSDKLARALRDKLGIPLGEEEQAIRNGHKEKTALKPQKRATRE
jgi:hypothetical protein